MYRREYENRNFEMEKAGFDRVNAKSAAKTRIAVFALAAAMMFGTGNAKEGYIYPQHHPKARFQDKMLPYGAAAYAQVAIQWLKNHK